MIHQRGFLRTLSQMARSYLLPEVEKRLQDGRLLESACPLEIWQFRYTNWRSTDGRHDSHIEINDEASIEMMVRARRAVTAGERLCAKDIYLDSCQLQPPKRGNQVAAFFYAFRTFLDWFIFFDFTPNYPVEAEQTDLAVAMPFPMQQLINEKAAYDKIKPLDQYLTLSTRNWPPCPGYYPNIMAVVASSPAGMDDKDTLAIMCQHLTCEYWRRRVVDWREFSVLGDRLSYVEKSIEAYISRDYVQAIYVLLPQFEGVINGYIQSQLGQEPRRKFQDNLQLFREAVTTRPVMLYPKRMLDIIIESIESGTFWAQSKTVADPRIEINRHGALHGAFVGFESQEIALKYLALLDGLSMVLLHDMMLTKDI